MAFHSFLFLLFAFPLLSHAEIPEGVLQNISLINEKGEYYGLMVTGKAERDAIVEQHLFNRDTDLPVVDISARRFLAGKVKEQRTILVMSGNGSVSAARTTQLLLTLFNIKAVIHYGRAASANPTHVRIGDVAIPTQFVHTGVWHWEKFEGGSADQCYANLTFSEYNVGENCDANKLQSVCFLPETVYSVEGEADAIFGFPADPELLAIANNNENTILVQCDDEYNCLHHEPSIKTVGTGGSADVHVNNAAYRDFLHTHLNISSIDAESAAIAMVCEREMTAFLAMRSITNYAGQSSGDESVIRDLWRLHAYTSIRALFQQLPSDDSVTATAAQIS